MLSKRNLKTEKLEGREKKRSEIIRGGQRERTDVSMGYTPAAISRKMNTINKAGRPIIPSRSSDESFSSGRARNGARRRRTGRRGQRIKKGTNGKTGRRQREKAGNTAKDRDSVGRERKKSSEAQAVCNQI